MVQTVPQFCSQCHAHVSASVQGVSCPACGGRLVIDPGTNSDGSGAPPAPVDHRGIVLPRRHAVGGVITPR